MNVPAAKSSLLKNIILFAAFASFFASCTVVRDYPVNKPFIYETNINVHGIDDGDKKKELVSKLEQQLHDSVNPRSVQKLVGFDHGLKFFYSVMKKPPVYDSINADKSIGFMRALLHSLGYYRDSIRYNDTVKVKDDQQRVHLSFDVYPGIVFKIDSISLNINDSLMKAEVGRNAASLDTLQQITLNSQRESLLKKGEPFAKPLISAEFDRLTDVFRNNGYLKFTRNELLAVWDTVGLDLLKPTFDPIEQAELFEALQKRRENPVADIQVRLRPNNDSLFKNLTRYYVGNVTVYPDISADTASFSPPEYTKYKEYNIVSYKNLFRHKVIAENIYLHRGELYDQRKHLKTLNRFNAIGSWRMAAVDAVPRGNSDTVDFVIRLTPALKYLFNTNIEGSQNLAGAFVGSNLIGVNFTLQNRNFMRGANQSNTRIGLGTELGGSGLNQTIQASAGQSIYFPRFIPKFRFLTDEEKQNARTSLGFNGRYVSRFDFLEMLSLNTSFGWDVSKRNQLLSIRFPNIEYTFLDRKKLLDSLINRNRSYAYIFNDGLVVSSIVNLSVSGGNSLKTNLFRYGMESSGLLLGFFRNDFFDSTLKRFFKVDASFQQTKIVGKYRKGADNNPTLGANDAIAWRVFAGAGYSIPYPESEFHGKLDENRLYMPFYKAYFAGGANSMRAWGLRKLGPGSTTKSYDRVLGFPDRFGDLQLEGNFEYRKFLADIQGVFVNTALFVDAGNIWNIRKINGFEDGQFAFDKLWKDLAIAVGTGIRVDFGFIKIRVDYAFKAKDPSPADPAAQNKWFYKWNLLKGTPQVGVDYPF
jgi:outer membrane protein insertion porin family